MDESAPKRIKLPPEKQTRMDLKMITTEVSVESVLDDAMQTAAMEVARYRMKVARGNTLDPKEARIIQGWIETLIKAKKEQRETEKDAKMDKMSNEQLLEIARRVVANSPTPIEIEPEDDSTED